MLRGFKVLPGNFGKEKRVVGIILNYYICRYKNLEIKIMEIFY